MLRYLTKKAQGLPMSTIVLLILVILVLVVVGIFFFVQFTQSQTAVGGAQTIVSNGSTNLTATSPFK
jgi:flagellar basal body-associated protein FliL